MGFMNRENFCRDYVLRLEKEFEYHDHNAEWAAAATGPPAAATGPQLWGEEDFALDVAHKDPNKANVESVKIAASPDQKLLAVATNAVIRIHNISTKEILSVLVGHPTNIWQMFFAPGEQDGQTTYRLVSEGANVSGNVGDIVVWRLDVNGKQLSTHELPAFSAEDLAQTAVSAISPELANVHSFDEDGIEAVRHSISAALNERKIQHLLKHLESFRGHFPTFNSNPFSHDGTKLVYLVHNKTTQHGTRPAEDLPQVKIVSFPALEPLHTLSGHSDAIMGAVFSPDGNTIASACWDQTFRLWSASTGECLHTIGPTGTQNWGVAFSPNGDRVLLSGAVKPSPIGLYNVITGEETARLEFPELDHWLRRFEWSPDGKEVAVVNKRSILLWTPPKLDEAGNGHVDEVLKIEADGSMLERFCSITDLEWADGGRKLIARTSESTVFVWDREKNVKRRLQRPKETPLKTGGDQVFAKIEGVETLVSSDGDGKVRFWKM